MSIATLVLAVSALAYPVDPFIGTQGGGHVFPGAVYPFGMVQLSPDTQTRNREPKPEYDPAYAPWARRDDVVFREGRGLVAVFDLALCRVGPAQRPATLARLHPARRAHARWRAPFPHAVPAQPLVGDRSAFPPVFDICVPIRAR
jgi:hypothetical protein